MGIGGMPDASVCARILHNNINVTYLRLSIWQNHCYR